MTHQNAGEIALLCQLLIEQGTGRGTLLCNWDLMTQWNVGRVTMLCELMT